GHEPGIGRGSDRAGRIDERRLGWIDRCPSRRVARPPWRDRMPNLVDLPDMTTIQGWDSVVVRRVQGEKLTLAIVELAPNAIVPEHRHANEQCGLVIEGEVRFRIGDEERLLGPGGTWRILGDTPHQVVTGPEGAGVIDVFAPPGRIGVTDRRAGRPSTRWSV